MRFSRPCVDCGRLVTKGGPRCTSCAKKYQTARDNDPARKEKKQRLYGGTYRARAKRVRDTATQCHICGKGFIEGDPFEADHLYPPLGVSSPLAPAHRSCNQAKGDKPADI